MGRIKLTADRTVRSEVLAGRLSREAIVEVTQVAFAVTRTGRYSTPAGSRTWRRDDVEDLVGDFFAKPGRLFDLAVSAGTGPDPDALFRGKIETSLKRILIDRLRSGPQGVLYKRIDRRMAKRDDVVDVAPEHWALQQWAARPHWGGDETTLVAAAAAVPVDSPRRGPRTTRGRAPRPRARRSTRCAPRCSTRRSRVARNTVRRVVAGRILPFDATHVAEQVRGHEPAAPPEPDVADLEAAGVAADAFWRTLSEHDRRLFPHVRVPARQLEEQGFLALKKSAIDARQRRLLARIEASQASTPDPELTGQALLRLPAHFGGPRRTGAGTALAARVGRNCAAGYGPRRRRNEVPGRARDCQVPGLGRGWRRRRAGGEPHRRSPSPVGFPPP